MRYNFLLVRKYSWKLAAIGSYMGGSCLMMPCDHPPTFFLHRQHSRYSVAMRYQPSMSRTLLMVLYSPAFVMDPVHKGWGHVSCRCQIRCGIHRNSRHAKKGSGDVGGWL